jgi:sugar/nucleoside kinase (ribokinase family)
MPLKIKKKCKYPVSGIGSTLIDLTAGVKEKMLEKFHLEKGRMHFVDDAGSKAILDAIAGHGVEATPGGSSANTLAGAAIYGARAALIGKVGSDHYGDLYIKETEAAGVKAFIARDPGLTGHAITLITPDGERTFAVNLGAAVRFNESDIDYGIISGSSVFHIEGYILEPENLRGPCIKAIEAAKEGGALVSIDLSDPALIGRIKDLLNTVVDKYVDIVFANEEEAFAFTGKKGVEALTALTKRCTAAAVKLGPKGSLLSEDGVIHEIKPFPAKVVNTNGAGDSYAAGVLYGITAGYTIEQSGILGSYSSALVVAGAGARLKQKIDPRRVADNYQG